MIFEVKVSEDEWGVSRAVAGLQGNINALTSQLNFAFHRQAQGCSGSEIELAEAPQARQQADDFPAPNELRRCE